MEGHCEHRPAAKDGQGQIFLLHFSSLFTAALRRARTAALFRGLRDAALTLTRRSQSKKPEPREESRRWHIRCETRSLQRFHTTPTYLPT